MKIQSKYYDVIDYLQDFNDEKIFLRQQSIVVGKVVDWSTNPIKWQFEKTSNKEALPYNFNLIFAPTKNVYDNPNLFDAAKKEQQEIENFGMRGTFHFLPTDLHIPITIYIRNNNFVIKPDCSAVSKPDHMSYSNSFHEEITKYFETEYQSFIWKCTVKPAWFITCPLFNGTYIYSDIQTTIWIHPPLAIIPNLLDYFNSYEMIFQEIEQYLWKDIENKDLMQNISNTDRIIGHGFDIKTSFRSVNNNFIKNTK